jgi:hypothetical protein
MKHFKTDMVIEGDEREMAPSASLQKLSAKYSKKKYCTRIAYLTWKLRDKE